MNRTDPPPSGNPDGNPVDARVPQGPSLDDLMRGIRRELTGGTEDALQTARITSEAAAVHAEAAEVAAEVLSLDEVIDRIRRELKRRRGGASDAVATSAMLVSAVDQLPRWQPFVRPLPIQPAYVLADMLRPSDSEFVDNAFRILLRRPAAPDEKAHYLAKLRGGVSKVEILGIIRFSNEGMQHNVHVDGLLIPYKLHRWRRAPVLGWFLATGIALFRLPRLFAHLQKLEATGAQESQQVGRTINELAQAVETRQARLDDQLDTLAGLQRRVQAKLSEQVADLTRTISHLHQQLSAQASAAAQVEARLAQLEQLETAMMVRLEAVQTSLSAHAIEQVDQLEAAMMARLESAQTSQSAYVVEQVGQLETTMTARLESMQTSLSARVETRLEQVGHFETAMAARFESARASLSTQVETRLEQFKYFEATTIARLETVQADQAGVLAQLASRLDAALSGVAKMTTEGAGIRRTVNDIERRLMALFDRTNQQAEGFPAAVSSNRDDGQASAGGLLNAHYVSFEDTFRGTREDIKTRAEHYLATLRDDGVEAGDGLVLDLGCGRGEWLEVLSDNGYTCRGVDMNGVMVSEALALGLDTVEQDAVAYLRGLGSESVSAITSMHLVEHLPYEVLIRLLDEALRVLRPGGVLILETPNPENLTVGSYWFYMDPTHRNPIPPALLQWVVEARGFESATVDRLTQNRQVFDIQPVAEDVAGANQINKVVGLLTAAPDYAVVARKPRAEALHMQGS
jgi:SAM-dependent methyltransferase